MIFTEREGRLKITSLDGKEIEDIRDVPKPWVKQDGGLFDLALHPDYARNGWVYLGYSEAGGPRGASETVVIRGRIKGKRLVDQETLHRSPQELYWVDDTHYGLRFLFDGQANLYYSIGDRGRQDDAQLLTGPHGKVHRVRDDGKIPDDNPFVGQAGAVASIWSYGNRNVQGLAFHPVTGALWATEHGPRGGDELNHLRKGKNYGWPKVTFGINYDGTPVSDKTEAPGLEPPVFQWTPSIGACGIAFSTSDRYPGWKNDLFAAGLVGKQLVRFTLDGDRVAAREVLFRGSRMRDVVQGPDGLLYVLLNNPGRIVRLVPAPRS
jgi:glucose/arabinose dehydrogenase